MVLVIGTHLVESLINVNYKVTVYDLFLYGNFLNRIKFISINGDIRNFENLRKL